MAQSKGKKKEMACNKVQPTSFSAVQCCSIPKTSSMCSARAEAAPLYGSLQIKFLSDDPVVAGLKSLLRASCRAVAIIARQRMP